MMASLNLEVFNMVASKAFNQRYKVTKDFTTYEAAWKVRI